MSAMAEVAEVGAIGVRVTVLTGFIRMMRFDLRMIGGIVRVFGRGFIAVSGLHFAQNVQGENRNEEEGQAFQNRISV